MSEHRFIKALLRQPVDQTPIWLMRQAGRYLPEYRATRQQAGDFLTLCKTPELACEVTLQPLRRFALDAAIIFSDILTIPDAMGLGLHFVTGEGPQFRKPVQTERDVEQLTVPDVAESLRYVFDAISLTKRELGGKVPLIGFAGSPWTLACYMIEGGPSKTYSTIKKMLYDRPDLLHNVLTKVTQATIEYLTYQIQAGDDAVMVFDTWGGILTTPAYELFSLSYMRDIIAALPKTNDTGQTIPSILFTKNAGNWLEAIAAAGSNAVGLDWTIDIAMAKQRIGNQVALQGNLDPSILLSNPETIAREAKAILDSFGNDVGHVFNLGHGITPDVPPEHVEILVNTVHDHAKQIRAQ